MREKLKNTIATVLKLFGLNQWKRLINRHKILILTYHGVLPERFIPKDGQVYEYRNVVSQKAFRAQMEWLNREFNPISAVELLTNLTNEQIPKIKFSVLVTFDDGFENNYEYAYPILYNMGIPAHFFLTTSFVGTTNLLWSEEINFRLMHTSQKKIEFNIREKSIRYLLETTKQKEAASAQIRNWLKKQKKETIKLFLNKFRQMLADVDLMTVPKERYKFMDWQQAKEMSENGMIMGSHTTEHYLLNSLNEIEALETLKSSKDAIENHLKTPCNLFAYPNGESWNYSNRDFRLLKRLGYHLAFTQIHGYNSLESILRFPFALRRLNISYNVSMPVFQAMVSNTWL